MKGGFKEGARWVKARTAGKQLRYVGYGEKAMRHGQDACSGLRLMEVPASANEIMDIYVKNVGRTYFPSTLFIWNMLILSTPKTAFIFESHMISRLSFGFWSSWPLIYTHNCFTT